MFMIKINLDVLPQKVRKEVFRIRDIAKSFGYSSYIVGGAIRDIILKKEIIDIDILILGNAIKVAEQYQSIYHSNVKFFKHFLSARIPIDDKQVKEIDLISARRESYENPGSLPSVIFGSLEEDLARRDFTINTLAYHLEDGEIIDIFGGIEDLEQGVIRVLKRGSFIEDPTRLLRAIRYKNRYHFFYDALTYSCLLEAIKENCLALVSNERVKKELFKTLQEDDIIPIILEYKKLGILYKVFFIKDLSPNQIKSFKDIYLYRKSEDILLTHLLILYADTSQEAIYHFCEHYSIKQSTFNMILHTRWLLNQIKSIKDMDLTPWQIYNLFSDLSPEQLLVIKLFHPYSVKYIEYFDNYLKDVHLLTDGQLLQNLGLKPGPNYSLIFKELLQKKLEMGWTKKEEEIDYIKQNIDKWRS